MLVEAGNLQSFFSLPCLSLMSTEMSLNSAPCRATAQNIAWQFLCVWYVWLKDPVWSSCTTACYGGLFQTKPQF